MRFIWFFLALLGCAQKAPSFEARHTGRAFYYWRTTFSLSPAEMQAIRRLGVSTLYVRFFDVAWEAGAAAPKAAISFSDATPKEVRIVPVIFLRAEVFRHTVTDEEVRKLASRVWRRTQQIAKRAHFSIDEVQMDCDWTDGTKDAYFAFLNALRVDTEREDTRISTTIRLHQIKYREKTGVPPADRGMLMFYNMGPIDADRRTRAIFDANTASKYLSRINGYPLPLDAALPIWSWTLHLRDNAVVGLLQDTDIQTLSAASWLYQIDESRFEAADNSFIRGEMVRKGDILEAETIRSEDTLAAARALLSTASLPSTERSRPFGTAALFDLSERNLHQHDVSSLETAFGLFR